MKLEEIAPSWNSYSTHLTSQKCFAGIELSEIQTKEIFLWKAGRWSWICSSACTGGRTPLWSAVNCQCSLGWVLLLCCQCCIRGSVWMKSWGNPLPCLHLSACLFQAYLQQAQELVILETIMLQTLGMSFWTPPVQPACHEELVGPK